MTSIIPTQRVVEHFSSTLDTNERQQLVSELARIPTNCTGMVLVDPRHTPPSIVSESWLQAMDLRTPRMGDEPYFVRVLPRNNQQSQRVFSLVPMERQTNRATVYPQRRSVLQRAINHLSRQITTEPLPQDLAWRSSNPDTRMEEPQTIRLVRNNNEFQRLSTWSRENPAKRFTIVNSGSENTQDVGGPTRTAFTECVKQMKTSQLLQRCGPSWMLKSFSEIPGQPAAKVSALLGVGHIFGRMFAFNQGSVTFAADLNLADSTINGILRLQGEAARALFPQSPLLYALSGSSLIAKPLLEDIFGTQTARSVLIDLLEAGGMQCRDGSNTENGALSRPTQLHYPVDRWIDGLAVSEESKVFIKNLATHFEQINGVHCRSGIALIKCIEERSFSNLLVAAGFDTVRRNQFPELTDISADRFKQSVCGGRSIKEELQAIIDSSTAQEEKTRQLEDLFKEHFTITFSFQEAHNNPAISRELTPLIRAQILNFVIESTPEQTKDFIRFATGNNLLPQGQRIDLTIYDSDPNGTPVGHGCAMSIDFQQASFRLQPEHFIQQLRTNIELWKTYGDGLQ